MIRFGEVPTMFEILDDHTIVARVPRHHEGRVEIKIGGHLSTIDWVQNNGLPFNFYRKITKVLQEIDGLTVEDLQQMQIKITQRLLQGGTQNIIRSSVNPGNPYFLGGNVQYHNALHFAAWLNDLKLAIYAITHKHQYINCIDLNGNTPLMLAIMFNNLQIVELLLHYGADVNIQNEFGFTALILAASFGRTQILPLLIKNSVDINKTDLYQRTALHWAFKGGNIDFAHSLLQLGIEKNRTDYFGYNEADYAFNNPIFPQLKANGLYTNAEFGCIKIQRIFREKRNEKLKKRQIIENKYTNNQVVTWKDFQDVFLTSHLPPEYNNDAWTIINALKALVAEQDSTIPKKNYTRFFNFFGDNFSVILPLIKELYELQCFVGFIDKSAATEKLTRLAKEKSTGTFICRTSNSEPHSFVFCVAVDNELRLTLEKFGEPNTGELVYSFLAKPQGNGTYKICRKNVRLADVPKTFPLIFKTPYQKYSAIK